MSKPKKKSKRQAWGGPSTTDNWRFIRKAMRESRIDAVRDKVEDVERLYPSHHWIHSAIAEAAYEVIAQRRKMSAYVLTKVLGNRLDELGDELLAARIARRDAERKLGQLLGPMSVKLAELSRPTPTGSAEP